MNYLNIHTDILKSVEFISAEPVERATWIALLGWCATQENGGVISTCSEWSDRQWQQLCGVMKSEVETMSKLYGFQSGDLVVSFYPVESEAAVKAKREAGKKGGRPKKSESLKPLSNQQEKPHGKPSGLSELKRNEREGKEKKRNIQPPALREVLDHMKSNMPKIHNEWTPVRVTKAVTLKYQTCIEAGWKDGRGQEIKNWKTKFMNMMKFEKPWVYSDEQAKNGFAEQKRERAQERSPL